MNDAPAPKLTRAQLQDLPIRWVLDPKPPHCPACLELAGDYPSYHHLMGRSRGAIPGYFPTYAKKTDFVLEGRTVACDDACRCHLEVEIGDQWHLFPPFLPRPNS